MVAEFKPINGGNLNNVRLENSRNVRERNEVSERQN
jgi:hypothetical protein